MYDKMEWTFWFKKKKTKLEFFVISMLFINAFSICFSCGNLLFRGGLQKSK